MAKRGDGMLCPFCLGRHDLVTTECPEQNLPIPREYARAYGDGTPVVHMLFIGYKNHGKTCLLASFLHQLYNGPALSQWPGFCHLGLTQATLDQIHLEYVNVLANNHVPQSTASFVPNSLILKLSNVPLRRMPLIGPYKQDDLILTMHDIAGEAYNSEDSAQETLPLMDAMDNLVFLVDLSLIREQASEGGRQVVEALHALLNTIYNVLEGLDQTGRKGILVCFTKADAMWGNPDLGPLAQEPTLGFPSVANLGDYMKDLTRRSDAIARFLEDSYPAFYNPLKHHFKPVRFATVSALGTGMNEDGRIDGLRPMNVFDPLLWVMRMEGLV